MKKLEKGALQADREAVKRLLSKTGDTDPLGRLSFQSRLDDIEERLRALDEIHEPTGSVALFFAGNPVHGSRSIDAEFASHALGNFQDLVTKKIASEERGRLADRGPLPLRTSTAMAVTDVVRGSFGFLLEESSANHTLADSSVKIAIDEITDMIARTASEDVNAFEEAVETLDSRLLVSLKQFFRVLDDSHASIRIVEDDREETLDGAAVRRGRERIDDTEIVDDPQEIVVGELLGLVPLGRRFEMRLSGSGETIRGTVLASLSQRYMTLIETTEERVVGRTWRTKMKIREIRERNKPPRRVYSLVGLLEPIEEANPPEGE